MVLQGRIRFENLSAVRVDGDGVDYGSAPVRLGDTVVPARVAYVVDGGRRSPTLRVEFEMREGRPVCTAVHLLASSSGRGVKTGDLTLPALDRLGYETFTELALTVAEKPSDWHIKDEAGRKRAAADIRSRGDAELKEVARVYRENITARPVEAVEEMGYTRRTASRRIDAARKKGFLPSTTQGRRNA